MEIKYLNLKENNIAFKQLISGPAPVGRILNYLLLTGKGILKHKNGNRDLKLQDNIASAWCSEFMVGLGLVFYVDEKGITNYPLQLTEKGKKLYDLLKNCTINFDESVNPAKCKNQLIAYSKDAYELFFYIFKSSVVCKNLCIYINNHGTKKFEKATFRDDYFKCFKDFYDGKGSMQASKRNAGFNRVPSLLQLCDFFNCLNEDNTYFYFDYDKLSFNLDNKNFIEIDQNKIKEFIDEEKRNERIISDLISRYGIDGTVAREMVIRNSSVQELFRNNLIARYGCKCAICNKKIEKVLIASHIVPAKKSNVLDKANCENGLLLCSLHDKLFDRYLISFDYKTGKLLYADVLKECLSDYQLLEDLFLEEYYLTDERKTYLQKHNFEFYEKNK